MALVGSTIGHYKILQQLGYGGMGEVLLAEDTRLERRVALKLLPPRVASDERRLLRFEREAKILAALNHPGIVTIHSVEEADGVRFITMELVEGSRLSDRIPPGGFDLDTFLTLSTLLLEALSAAHHSGVIHRDLKPGNIMVTPDGRIKVLDFGLARLNRSFNSDSPITGGLTQEGELVGTLGYVPPEILQGQSPDERSDLFAVGILLYEMATGRSPFTGDNPGALVCSVLNHDPPPPTTLNPALPPTLDEVIGRCLEKEPDKRHASVDELLASLRQLRQGGAPQTAAGLRRQQRAPFFRRWAWSALGLAALAGLLAWVMWFHGKPPAERGRSRMVVFPFENLGPAEDKYFADGLTEELTSRLAGAGGLDVISRTSAVQYDRRGKTMRQIGADLQVDYVLEGSVRWDKTGRGRVIVTPQLIRTADDTHLWADRFELVMEDIFDVQQEIAEEVLQQLDVTLTRQGTQRQETRPTRNLEAYQAYLRGLSSSRGFLEPELRLSVDMFGRAVELDPDFALAQAGLAQVQAGMPPFRYDLSEDRLRLAKAAAERALALAPDLPEAHRSMAYVRYWGYRDYDGALAEISIAARLRPNDSVLMAARGYILRRRGQFDEAIHTMEQALRLDPRNHNLMVNLALTYRIMRRYADADRLYSRGISLAPDDMLAYGGRVYNYWLWDGATGRASRVLDEMPRQDNQYVMLYRQFQLSYDRRYQELLERLAGSGVELMSDQIWYFPRSLVECWCYRELAQPAKARAAGAQACRILEQAARETPADPRVHCSLGWVYALLGRPAEAIREGELGVRLCPVEKDTVEGPAFELDLARIYAWSGEPELALDRLERMLAIPGNISPGLLRLDPVWQPLADQPRFRKLLERSLPERN